MWNILGHGWNSSTSNLNVVQRSLMLDFKGEKTSRNIFHSSKINGKYVKKELRCSKRSDGIHCKNLVLFTNFHHNNIIHIYLVKAERAPAPQDNIWWRMVTAQLPDPEIKALYTHAPSTPKGVGVSQHMSVTGCYRHVVRAVCMQLSVHVCIHACVKCIHRMAYVWKINVSANVGHCMWLQHFHE